ncbi:MAG TPA: peptidylprolyl isomerase [Dissulfurispiraceae bacterium]|nr:peptidylprolyl isomerase [Dissulfurispiraceae bacterium]
MIKSRVLGLGFIVIAIGIMAVVSSARSEDSKPKPADKAAIVNGAPIDRAEFDGELLTVQKAVLGYGKPITATQVASIQKEVLESMVRREILYQESRKAGIKPDENAVDKELKALKQQFANETEYKNELSRRNISEGILRSRIERNSAVQQYIERQFAAKVTVTDSDMVSYYQSHLDLFKQSLLLRVSHILILTDPKWEEARKQEARRKADQIMKDLKNGKDFAAIAREQSDSPTRANGGDLGYIKAGQLEKQFESAVLALKPGETTDLISSEYGFHIFKLTEKKPETVLAYENVKDKIKQFLREEKAKQEADLFAKNLREKARVEILLN